MSGDQFCVYVANRLAIPSPVPEQLVKFGTGDLRLDSLTKSYIYEKFEYQFAIVASSKAACAAPSLVQPDDFIESRCSV